LKAKLDFLEELFKTEPRPLYKEKEGFQIFDKDLFISEFWQGVRLRESHIG
jgi:hypothetical protein